MTPEILSTEAVKAVIGALTKEAVGKAFAAGGQVWEWLKTKLSGGRSEELLASVEAAPAKPSSQTRLQGELLALLEDRPELATELDRLLQDGGLRTTTTQTATVTGDGNQTGQNAGNDNSIVFGAR